MERGGKTPFFWSNFGGPNVTFFLGVMPSSIAFAYSHILISSLMKCLRFESAEIALYYALSLQLIQTYGDIFSFLVVGIRISDLTYFFFFVI